MPAQSMIKACHAVADAWDNAYKQTPHGQSVPAPQNELKQWIAAMQTSSVADLIEATGWLTTAEHKREANLKAVREAMISEVERRNADHLAQTMEKLDNAATKLTWVSLALAFIGIAIGLIQVWQTMRNPTGRPQVPAVVRPAG